MSKKQLIDYTRWLWDMDRIKLDMHMKFETPERLVDFFLLPKLPTKKALEALCEGCKYEHDLLGCISSKDSECQIKTKENKQDDT